MNRLDQEAVLGTEEKASAGDRETEGQDVVADLVGASRDPAFARRESDFGTKRVLGREPTVLRQDDPIGLE